MAMNEKLDPELATRLREFLKRKHIDGKRLLIDIESETIEWDPMDDLNSILQAPPDLSSEEAETAIENIRQSREEWPNCLDTFLIQT